MLKLEVILNSGICTQTEAILLGKSAVSDLSTGVHTILYVIFIDAIIVQ